MAGIRKRHTTRCRTRRGGACTCQPSYEASVYSPRDDDKIRKTFRTRAEAVSWAADAKRQIDQGVLRTPTTTTLRAAAEVWLRDTEAGLIRSRSGHVYKPATLRGYRRALEDKVLPEIGARKVSAIATSDLQRLVDRWQAEGQPPATIRNTLKPLQALYRRLKAREGLALNPT